MRVREGEGDKMTERWGDNRDKEKVKIKQRDSNTKRVANPIKMKIIRLIN